MQLLCVSPTDTFLYLPYYLAEPNVFNYHRGKTSHPEAETTKGQRQQIVPEAETTKPSLCCTPGPLKLLALDTRGGFMSMYGKTNTVL